MNNENREPVVAGAFYPADADSLKAMLNDLFSLAEKKDLSGRIVGLVAPHAGYPYSGKTVDQIYDIAIDMLTDGDKHKFQDLMNTIDRINNNGHYSPGSHVLVP